MKGIRGLGYICGRRKEKGSNIIGPDGIGYKRLWWYNEENRINNRHAYDTSSSDNICRQ